MLIRKISTPTFLVTASFLNFVLEFEAWVCSCLLMSPPASPQALPHHTGIFSHFPLQKCPLWSLGCEQHLAHCCIRAPDCDCHCWPQLLIAHSPLYPWGHLVPRILPLPTLSCLGPPICYSPSFAARCHFKNAKYLSCKHFQGLSTYLLLYSQDLAYCFHILGTWMLVK